MPSKIQASVSCTKPWGPIADARIPWHLQTPVAFVEKTLRFPIQEGSSRDRSFGARQIRL
eukprot:scaffold36338_cov191-Amphora_coffeaeformis.AAC.5